MRESIGILDCGLGNIESLIGAFEDIGVIARVVEHDLSNYSHIVIPGVGTWDEMITNLEKRYGLEAVKEDILFGVRKYLLICLGFQVLFESSDEGNLPGLSVFNGHFKDFAKSENNWHINIGWYTLPKLQYVTGIKSRVYFVHRYYLDNIDKAVDSVSFTRDDVSFIGMVEKNNIIGCQFHPERSGTAGLQILKYWVYDFGK